MFKKLANSQALNQFREKCKVELENQQIKILVCAGTGCMAGGSLKIYEELKRLCENSGKSVQVLLEKHVDHPDFGIKKSGCNGFCELGPLVRIDPMGWLYTKVSLDDCQEIFEKSLIKGELIERLIYENNPRFAEQDKIPFYEKQTRVVLENCGHIDSEDIGEYIAKGGYVALQKALFEYNQDEIIEQMKISNLRGRGGGGFPTWRKWEQVKRQTEEPKYVVCNGDEGDPGAFMDRSIMEGNPHSVIEGMLIAGISSGCHEGYIYVRAEYPLAVQRLKTAIEQATNLGLLGKDILGSGFEFNMHINQGAGAFVCGEGSAMAESIEGNRGMPRVKPPRMVEKGLYNKPTILNNVETFAAVPLIIEKGGDWYLSFGPNGSPGTKAFALTGNIKNTGLIEVPMGTTLREVIFTIGGGIKNGKKFKAVQIGGPSGGCLTEEHLDLPLDFDSLKSVGAMIGSGGLVVMDEDTCMVEVARFFMNFTQNESCGKCVPCREGTKRMKEILEKIVAGKGELSDLELLQEVAETVSEASLCGLGKSAANPVLSTLKYFKDEYIAHVVDKKCPAHVCAKLKTIEIDKNLCKGCSKCARNCPAGAIKGQIKSPFEIDQTACLKCGACLTACPFGAIKEV